MALDSHSWDKKYRTSFTFIMVGEMRDNETAQIGARAALVGRMLLSSLHANNALGAIPRLLDMQVEPHILASTLHLVVAQRLVRKLCTRCRESYAPPENILAILKQIHDFEYAVSSLQRVGVLAQGLEPLKGLILFGSKGCAHCDHTGYQGRTALYEILEISDALRERIALRESTANLGELARQEGMKTMFADGLAKAILGTTDLNEVLRATP